MSIRGKILEVLFRQEFGSEPLLIHSPGRVNLIGEHTDYNDGFVLPAAINKRILLAIAPNHINRIRLFAADMDEQQYETEVAESYEKSGMGWPDYILGVVDQLSKQGELIEGFDCLFGGDIPIGAGLSSSAALEGGILTGLNTLFDLELTTMEMAKIGQQAENQFVDVQCGIMDQFANLHGKKGSVLRLDCRTLEYSEFPFEKEDIAILLCDTKVRRELASSEYNIRREQCEEGVQILQKYNPEILNLRDVSSDLLDHHKEEMPEIIYRRCRFVLDENRRVLQACDDLSNGDIKAFGKRMYGSHAGLRDLYEVSCKELDTLVEATEELDDVLGSRMMGGGFGGCTINLVVEREVGEIKKAIEQYYRDQLAKPVEFYVAKIGGGTSVMESASS